MQALIIIGAFIGSLAVMLLGWAEKRGPFKQVYLIDAGAGALLAYPALQHLNIESPVNSPAWVLLALGAIAAIGIKAGTRVLIKKVNVLVDAALARLGDRQ